MPLRFPIIHYHYTLVSYGSSTTSILGSACLIISSDPEPRNSPLTSFRPFLFAPQFIIPFWHRWPHYNPWLCGLITLYHSVSSQFLGFLSFIAISAHIIMPNQLPNRLRIIILRIIMPSRLRIIILRIIMPNWLRIIMPNRLSYYLYSALCPIGSRI